MAVEGASAQPAAKWHRYYILEIDSNYGHDSFLLEVDRLAELARDFLGRFMMQPRKPGANGRNFDDVAMNI